MLPCFRSPIQTSEAPASRLRVIHPGNPCRERETSDAPTERGIGRTPRGNSAQPRVFLIHSRAVSKDPPSTEEVMQVLEAQPTLVTSRAQEFMTRVYGWMAAGLMVTAVIAGYTLSHMTNP